jgi:ABC-2 type transport system ATP-binding protein
MITKSVSCPRCKTVFSIHGDTGEKKVMTCPSCHLKGSFTFPGAMAARGKTSIEIHGLTKQYKDVRAVDNISFNVRSGEIFGFLGPNGAGKTTTIKAILGLIHVDTGEITIDGYDIHEKSIKARTSVGYLPERISFYENLTPVQTLNFFCELRGVNKSIVPGLIKEVGLEEAIERKVGTFSKGMAQLLGIAQALIGNPRVYILDEPMAGLDARWVKTIRDKIRILNNRGATVIFSSHILSEVENLCHRVGIINKGRLIAEDSVENLNEYLRIQPQLAITIQGLENRVPEVIQTLDVVEQVSVKNDVLYITCDASAKTRVLRVLEDAGYTIINIKTIEPSLEDAFIKLIQGDAQ